MICDLEKDLKKACIAVLNECVVIINEQNRAVLYKVLVQLITHEKLDLEFTHLLEQLGALYPIELQSNCIDVCIRNFSIFSNFIKRKTFKNFIPLVKQMAFNERILDLIMLHIFEPTVEADVRLLALEAFNLLLVNESDSRFIEELQQNSNLIEKIIKLSNTIDDSNIVNLSILEQIAGILSLIVQHLTVSEQFAIASEYLPKLNLQKAADLYITKGLLGFLHQDISMDDHFESLLNDLSVLSLTSDKAELRQVAHHLLCSLVNKIEYNDSNKCTLHTVLKKLKEEIKRDNVKAVEVLSWIAKALMMRGLEEAGEIVEDVKCCY